MMHLTLNKTIGNHKYTFTFLGETLHDVIMESQHLGFQDVHKCGICESEKLYLRAYITEPDKYEYLKIHCADCKASLTFGKTKKEGAFFLRRHEDGKLAWEKREDKGTDGKAKHSEPEVDDFPA